MSFNSKCQKNGSSNLNFPLNFVDGWYQNRKFVWKYVQWLFVIWYFSAFILAWVLWHSWCGIRLCGLHGHRYWIDSPPPLPPHVESALHRRRFDGSILRFAMQKILKLNDSIDRSRDEGKVTFEFFHFLSIGKINANKWLKSDVCACVLASIDWYQYAKEQTSEQASESNSAIFHHFSFFSILVSAFSTRKYIAFSYQWQWQHRSIASSIACTITFSPAPPHMVSPEQLKQIYLCAFDGIIWRWRYLDFTTESWLCLNTSSNTFECIL